VKNIKSVLAFTVAMLFAGLSFAEGKVAVLDVQNAILRTEVAQKELKSMQADAEFAALKAKGVSLETELKALIEEMQTKGLTWSEERKADQRKKMEYKQADLQLLSKKLQAEQTAVVQGLLRRFAKAAQVAVQDVIKSGGYGLVLDAKAAQYYDTSFDITAKVTDKLNKAK